MLQLVPQTPFSAKLPPRKIKNSLLRTREYLSEHEVEKLRKAARNIGRHGHRDDTLIFLMFRHALRSSEATSLRWEQLDLAKGIFHVKRAKNGISSTHPLRGPELRALRRLMRDYPQSPYVFCSERNAPLSGRTVRHIVARAGHNAKFPFTIHPHFMAWAKGGFSTKLVLDIDVYSQLYLMLFDSPLGVPSVNWKKQRKGEERCGEYCLGYVPLG